MPVGRTGCALAPGRAAEWTFVVGQAFLAAVPIGTENGVMARLTALINEPRLQIEALVALLPLAGEHAVNDFVVVVPLEPTDDDGIPVSAVVRGAIAADVFSVGGSRRFSDRDIRPWLLADFRAVTGLSIGSSGAPVVQPAALWGGQTIGLGAVSGTALFWSLTGPPAAVHPALLNEPENVDDTVIRAPMGTGMSIGAGMSMSAGTSTSAEDTILRPRARLDGDVDPVVVVPGADGDDDADAAVHHDDAADDTVIMRRSAAGAAGSVPVPELGPPVPAIARYGFRLGDGPVRRLDAAYLLGRNPRPARIAAGPPSRLLTVASPTAAVSGTHLEIRQEGDAVVVTDLGSTNGTIVHPPRGRKRRLRSEQSLTVVPGTRVDIGDGNIVEILR